MKIIIISLFIIALTYSGSPIKPDNYIPSRSNTFSQYTYNGPYCYELNKAARKYDVPLRALVALAHGESSMDHLAVSKDGHDKGLFQFRDYFYDEFEITNPFDSYQSADKAAKLLLKNYSKLGCWIYASAAHKQGLNRTRKEGISEKTKEYLQRGGLI